MTDSFAQPRVAARAFPVQLLKGKQEARDSRSTRPVRSHFHPVCYCICPRPYRIFIFIERNKKKKPKRVVCLRVTSSDHRQSGVALGHARQCSREMRHGKRLLKSNSRVRGMDTVLTLPSLTDLTTLDVSLHLGIAPTGVFQE